MTLSMGVVVLVVVLAAVKMKGAQLPHVLLGMILMASAAPGSFVSEIGVLGLDLVNTVINAVASAVGEGNVV